mmetsp:Transcript_18035/g.41740  ORF Transcript_18035/g.41740 Transcript_18035/m.41740 type:complete len:258 (+) Transcript_18035:553-1326(+)
MGALRRGHLFPGLNTEDDDALEIRVSHRKPLRLPLTVHRHRPHPASALLEKVWGGVFEVALQLQLLLQRCVDRQSPAPLVQQCAPDDAGAARKHLLHLSPCHPGEVEAFHELLHLAPQLLPSDQLPVGKKPLLHEPEPVSDMPPRQAFARQPCRDPGQDDLQRMSANAAQPLVPEMVHRQIQPFHGPEASHQDVGSVPLLHQGKLYGRKQVGLRDSVLPNPVPQPLNSVHLGEDNELPRVRGPAVLQITCLAHVQKL